MAATGSVIAGTGTTFAGIGGTVSGGTVSGGTVSGGAVSGGAVAGGAVVGGSVAGTVVGGSVTGCGVVATDFDSLAVGCVGTAATVPPSAALRSSRSGWLAIEVVEHAASSSPSPARRGVVPRSRTWSRLVIDRPRSVFIGGID